MAYKKYYYDLPPALAQTTYTTPYEPQQYEQINIQTGYALTPAAEGAYWGFPIHRPHFVDASVYIPSVFCKPKAVVSSARIFIQERPNALLYAKSVCDYEETGSCLILWTDASVVRHKGHSAGYAAVYKRHGQWQQITGATAGVPQTTTTAELEAIEHALYFVLKETHGQDPYSSPKSVKIFTDSTSTLRSIHIAPVEKQNWVGLKNTQVRNPVLEYLRLLEQAGVSLEFHWVPRGEVEGNIKADAFAREARKLHISGELPFPTGGPYGISRV